jgi:hypothetical protein
VDEWLTSEDLERLLDLLQGQPSDRKLRLFACACARQVWGLLARAGASRRAVEAAEQFAGGTLTTSDLQDAHRQAQEALSQAGHLRPGAVSMPTANAARAAAWCAHPPQDAPSLLLVVLEVARLVCGPATSASGGPGATPANLQQAQRARRTDQARLLRCIFGNPFRTVALSPDWQTQSVRILTEAAYAGQAPRSGHLDALDLKAVADALEEAGCADQAALDHLRGPGPHVRGCHVLDLLLGKE